MGTTFSTNHICLVSLFTRLLARRTLVGLLCVQRTPVIDATLEHLIARCLVYSRSSGEPGREARMLRRLSYEAVRDGAPVDTQRSAALFGAGLWFGPAYHTAYVRPVRVHRLEVNMQEPFWEFLGVPCG